MSLNGEFVLRYCGRYNRLDQLYMEKININTVARNTFERNFRDLEHLYLGGNQIELIEDRAFEGLHNLKTLSLCENKLKQINQQTFKGLSNVSRLFLHKNQIETIGAGAFDDLGRVERLILSTNRLTRVDAGTFRGLTRLEILDLTHNLIDEVDPNAFEHVAATLVGLWLHDNRLKRVDRVCFECLNRVVLIRLENNLFERRVRPYFDGLKVADDWNIETNEKYLYDSGGFLTDFNEFLDQFTAKSSGNKVFRFLDVTNFFQGHKILAATFKISKV